MTNNQPDWYTGATIQADEVADIQEKGDTTIAGDPTLSGSATDVLAAIVTAETKRTSLVPNNHPDWYTGATIQADQVADIQEKEIPQLLEIQPFLVALPMC